MSRSSIEFFRAAVAECRAAAQSVHDSAIRQAYLELVQGWQALADEIEHLRSQTLRPRIYSGHALPRRSLDDFYEVRTASSTRQDSKHAGKHAVEHPALGRHRDAARTAAELISAKRPSGRARAG